MLIDTCGMAATPVYCACSAFRGDADFTLMSLEKRLWRERSALIGSQQRADVFHGAFEAALDVVRHLAQFVVLALEPGQTLGKFLGPRLLGLQTFLDHRFQSIEGVVDAVFGMGCLG